MGFWRRVVALGAGTVASQGILVLASPVLTRMFDPASFGTFAAYSGLISMLAPVATGRLELKLPLAEEEELGHIVSSCLYLILCVSLLAGIATALWGVLSEQSFLWPILVASGTASIAMTSVGSYFGVRTGQIHAVAWNGVIRSALSVAFQIGAALVGIKQAGLVVGDAVGRVIASVRLVHLVLFRKIRVECCGHKIWHYIRANARYSMVASAGGLVNAGGLQAPMLLLAWLYGAEHAGLFALAQRVVGVPVRLVGAAIAQAFVGALGLHNEDSKLSVVYTRTVVRLLVVGGVLVGVVVWSAPYWIGLVFGAQWGDVADILRITGIATVMQFAVGSLTQTLNAVDLPGRQVGWEAARLLVVSVGIVISKSLGADIDECLMVYVGCVIVSYIGLFVVTKKSLDFAVRPEHSLRGV